MKLTSVELHPNGSDYVGVLSFRDPRRENPYNVKAIVGLAPDDVVPKFYAGSGNSKFYNLSLSKRDVVVRIALNPRFDLGESYSSLRDDMYKIIASSRTGLVQIQFKNGATVLAAVSGFVTKMEAAHFEKEQEVQVTLSCPDPLLRAPDPINVDVGRLDPTLMIVQDDLSTAPHGFAFDLFVNTAVPDLIITSSGDDTWSFGVSIPGGFQYLDVIHFSSEYNAKDFYYTRAGVVTYLADRIVDGSVWPIMFPGLNQFVFTYPDGLDMQAFSYYPTYWGV